MKQVVNKGRKSIPGRGTWYIKMLCQDGPEGRAVRRQRRGHMAGNEIIRKR